MDGRTRVRRHLSGAEADRPPFLPFVMDLAARLSQSSPAELFADPQLLTQSLMEVSAVCGFDAIGLAVPPELVEGAVAGKRVEGEEALGVVREGVHRIRGLTADRLGIAVVLPGPRSLARRMGRPSTADELDDVVAGLLACAGYVQPQHLDAVGVLEVDPVPEESVDDLRAALAALWNSARYYSIPSLCVAARAGRSLGAVGASAVSVWDGASPADLIASGAGAVGVPVAPADQAEVPPLASRGFFTTAGEIPGETDVQVVRDMVERLGRVAEGAPPAS